MLQSSGPIRFSDVNVELNRTSNQSPTRLSRGTVPQPDSLFGDATGVINKTAPHRLSEFYGYNQVREFAMDTTPYANAGLACADTDLGVQKWHDGLNTYPEVGDTIWNEGTSTTLFNGGGNWFHVPVEDSSLRISAAGVVLEKEDCNQTFSFTLSRSVVDEDATTVTITITSNTSWTLSENQTWTSLSATSGSGNGSVTLNIDAHTGSGNRVVTITGTYGLGTVQDTVTQLDIQYQTITLQYSASSSAAACSAGGVFYKSDTTSLSTASIILNFATEALAPAGYYSNGTIWKFWNGSAFTGSGDFC